MRLVRLLDMATDSNPENLKSALARSGTLEKIINDLDLLYRTIESHRKTSRRRQIVQADENFLVALQRYETAWSEAWLIASGIDLDFDLDEMLSTTSDTKKVDTEAALSTDISNLAALGGRWEFDFDDDSAAELVEGIIENASYKIEDSEFYSRALGGWTWLTATVGLNLRDIEDRWRELPVFIVKQSVSDLHGIENHRSLFAYLEEIQKAYVGGADLAAVAMCRATTEIIVKGHYFSGTQNKMKKIGLRTLVEKIESNIPELQLHNFIDKIESANDLLHFNRVPDIVAKDESRQLVRNWILPIQDLINMAPNLPWTVQ